jgi:hypothetical protein
MQTLVVHQHRQSAARPWCRRTDSGTLQCGRASAGATISSDPGRKQRKHLRAMSGLFFAALYRTAL